MPRIWSVLVNVQCKLEINFYSVVVGYSVFYQLGQHGGTIIQILEYLYIYRYTDIFVWLLYQLLREEC